MRLQNPHAVGQVYSDQNKGSLFGRAKLLITVQFLMLMVLMSWMAVDLYLKYNSPEGVSLSEELTAALAMQKSDEEPHSDSSVQLEVVENALNLQSLATTSTSEIFEKVDDGDYLITLPGNKLLVYRPGTAEVVYSGDDASRVAAAAERDIAKEIAAAAKKNGLLENDDSKAIIQQITDISSLLRQDGEFFALAKNGDYLAFFPTEHLVVVFDSLEAEIVVNGNWKYDSAQ